MAPTAAGLHFRTPEMEGLDSSPSHWPGDSSLGRGPAEKSLLPFLLGLLIPRPSVLKPNLSQEEEKEEKVDLLSRERLHILYT